MSVYPSLCTSHNCSFLSVNRNDNEHNNNYVKHRRLEICFSEEHNETQGMTNPLFITKQISMKILILLFLATLLNACTGLPENVKPVRSFDVDKYTGKWYEIARLDHSLEDGLTNVTATYTKNADGTLKVINRGYLPKKNRYKSIEGLARFVRDENTGHLKVSFFGPFYASYIIFELDEEYQYAFVSGHSTDYLWLLARSPQISPEILRRFSRRAEALGFDVEKLIFVEHTF